MRASSRSRRAKAVDADARWISVEKATTTMLRARVASRARWTRAMPPPVSLRTTRSRSPRGWLAGALPEAWGLPNGTAMLPATLSTVSRGLFVLPREVGDRRRTSDVAPGVQDVRYDRPARLCDAPIRTPGRMSVVRHRRPSADGRRVVAPIVANRGARREDRRWGSVRYVSARLTHVGERGKLLCST